MDKGIQQRHKCAVEKNPHSLSAGHFISCPFPDLSSVWCSPGLEAAAYFLIPSLQREHAAAAAKSLQTCLTLCDFTDSSPPGSPVPGILQARTLEWVAISFPSAWKWKVKVKLLSSVRLFMTPWTAAYQAPPPMGVSRQEYWSGVPLPYLQCPTLWRGCSGSEEMAGAEGKGGCLKNPFT